MFTIQKTQRQWIIDIFSMLVFFSLFYALWMGSYALFTPDEGRYSEVAREMIASSDYVTPRLNGVAFLDKPVLYYWLQASAIHWFGLKEWALRFWPAALGIIGSLITYTAGYNLFNRRTGIIAAIVVITSPLYYGAAHYANLDLEVAVLISNALLFFLMGMHYSTTRWRTPLLLSAYAFAGLAFLTKGLIGIVFPAIIISVWIVLLNRWHTLTRMRLFSGLSLFFLMVIPWYYLVQSANPEFLHFFFVTQQVSRFLTKATFNSQAVFWFYIPVVLIGFMPWSIFIIQSLAFHLKRIWQNRQAYQNELFLLIWIFLIFIFFSIPKSKTVGYILPIFPALALLSAHYLDFCWNKITCGITVAMKSFIVVSALVVILCLAIPHVSFITLPQGLHFYLYITAMIFLFAGGVTFFYVKKSSLAIFFRLLTLTACLFLSTLVASTQVINSNTIKPLALELKAHIKPDDEIVTYFKYYQDLPIYLERRITIVADWHANDIQYNDNWLREMWYGMPFQDTSKWLIEENAFWQRWNSNKRLFIFMNRSYYKSFSEKTTHPIYKLGEYNDVILISNKQTLRLSTPTRTS